MPTRRFTRRRFLRNVAIVGGTALTGFVGYRQLMASPARFPVSDHCDGRRFFNPRFHENRNWFDVLRWKFTSKGTKWPEEIDAPPQQPPPAPTDGTLTATWINHATVLLQTRHGNILTDPVYSERCSPVSFAGPKRVHPPGVKWEDLPPIDLILLSHDHYDHCDAATLARFAAQPKPPLVITPLGNGALLRDFGFAADRIVELDWWEAHEISHGFHVRATPARHWSNRVTGGRNHRLWSGFFIQAGGRTVYYTGDTAWDEHMFGDVRERCGPPDLALIPIGAYEPRWFMAAQHCNPEEALRIHRTVGAGKSLGVHWGTFQLTDEGIDAPVKALAAARREIGVPEDLFRTLEPGGSLRV
ncbi:MBL fold metallo-hydrolase [Actomonas aquatica]|uniref:MBL fold metallo-hydrolase n=1 Tax=Actomonas aquatica TaxID=2866162 RepID=A0ABZ1CE97_9BACT|nr:MBL fold metallo-hydrolase [Opitutus sp. WL0086]WRQ89761.1 MBL fold metallo-hydrolase [Opitutus sp. WL0086]